MSRALDHGAGFGGQGGGTGGGGVQQLGAGVAAAGAAEFVAVGGEGLGHQDRVMGGGGPLRGFLFWRGPLQFAPYEHQ